MITAWDGTEGANALLTGRSCAVAPCPLRGRGVHGADPGRRADRPLQEVKRLKVEHRTEEDEAADAGERRASPTQTGSGVVVETQELPRGTGKTGEKAASSGAAASCGCSGRQEVMIQVMVLLLNYLTYSN